MIKLKLIIALTVCLGTNLLSALERVKTSVIDPMHNIPIEAYAVRLGNGTIYYTASISKVVEKLLACPLATQLVDRVLKNGPIIIKHGKPWQVPAGGSWAPEARLVLINSEESFERQLGHSLFELSNALQYTLQLELIEDTESGKVAREEYVKRWEFIEYAAGREFIPVIKHCIATRSWSQDSAMKIPQLFDKFGATFDSFWAYIRRTEHSNLFRENWDSGHKTKYCRFNPKASDC